MTSASRLLEHDGSFPGFLCAVCEAINDRAAGQPVPRVRGAGSETGLFDEPETIPRDDGRARSLWLRLSARAGAEAMRTLLEAFSSDVPGADGAVAAMACRLWLEGERAFDDLSSPEAALLEKAACRTRAEAHHYTGITRFSELADGSWYAAIEPACDILPLIADHFAARFPAMRWAIEDRSRGRAVVHEPGAGWTLADGFRIAADGAALPGKGDGSDGEAPRADPPLSDSERQLRAMWRGYFRSVSIRERANPGLQRSHLPLKNRRHLTEFKPAEE